MYPLDSMEIDAGHALVCVADKPAMKRLVGMGHGALCVAGGVAYTYRDDVGEDDMLLEDNMASLANWTQGGSGSWSLSSGAVPSVTFGGSDGWWGPNLLRDLGREITDCTVIVTVLWQTNNVNQMGRVSLRLLDSSRNIVYQQQVVDAHNSLYNTRIVVADSIGVPVTLSGSDSGSSDLQYSTGAITYTFQMFAGRKGRSIEMGATVKQAILNNKGMRPFRFIELACEGYRSLGVNQALPVQMTIQSVAIQSSRVNRSTPERVFANSRFTYFYEEKQASWPDTQGWRFWSSAVSGAANNNNLTRIGAELAAAARPVCIEYQNCDSGAIAHPTGYKLQTGPTYNDGAFSDAGPARSVSNGNLYRHVVAPTPGSPAAKCHALLVTDSGTGTPRLGVLTIQTSTPYVMAYDDQLLIKPDLMSGAWVPATVSLDELLAAQDDDAQARAKRLERALEAQALPLAAPAALVPGMPQPGFTGPLAWASISSGAEGSLAVSVPDAALGDLVEVSTPAAFLAVAGLRLSRAMVTAPGTVTLFVLNHTGGGLTPASGSNTDPWAITTSRHA